MIDGSLELVQRIKDTRCKRLLFLTGPLDVPE